MYDANLIIDLLSALHICNAPLALSFVMFLNQKNDYPYQNEISPPLKRSIVVFDIFTDLYITSVKKNKISGTCGFWSWLVDVYCDNEHGKLIINNVWEMDCGISTSESECFTNEYKSI